MRRLCGLLHLLLLLRRRRGHLPCLLQVWAAGTLQLRVRPQPRLLPRKPLLAPPLLLLLLLLLLRALLLLHARSLRQRRRCWLLRCRRSRSRHCGLLI